MSSLNARVKALEQAYQRIARTRMKGLPMMCLRLDVQAVGFAEEDDGEHALGVLVTPWFMNLVRLPLPEHATTALAVGQTAPRDIGTRCFDFIGAHEPGLGAFESCSLFSPMFEFADQAAAVATAHEALKELRANAASRPPAQPARRGFLFGRSGAAA
jgi:[NiFe] hydrogenase assembly HybE family chaperone